MTLLLTVTRQKNGLKLGISIPILGMKCEMYQGLLLEFKIIKELNTDIYV